MVQVLRDAEEHLTLATKEQSYYSSLHKKTREICNKFYTDNNIYTPPRPGANNPPLSEPAVPFQVNYLTDKAPATGKGANVVASLLYHYFATHGLHLYNKQAHSINVCK